LTGDETGDPCFSFLTFLTTLWSKFPNKLGSSPVSFNAAAAGELILLNPKDPRLTDSGTLIAFSIGT